MGLGKATVQTRRLITEGLLLLCIAGAIAACGSSNNTQPEAVATPHFVDDLSKLSSKPVSAISNEHAVYEATHADTKEGSGHAMQGKFGAERHVGTDAMPAVQRLLNPKAAQFAQFSVSMLDKLWGQLRVREGDDDIARLKVPTNIKPVILTATLAPNGKLQEIVVDQRSGKTIIDKLFIDACKKSIWAQNPPKAAAQPDGTYVVRIEGSIENFASTKENHWTFTTDMGLALL